jgi:hypothetical protein
MTVAEQTAPKLTAYELQVLIGTTISGCNMSPDRTFDLPAAWARLKGLGLIDRADGIANATPAGVELVASTLTELQHRREAEAAPDELRSLVHQPNPTDPTRWDIAPGKHKAFSALCARLAASPSYPASGVRVIGYMRKEDVVGSEPAKSSFWVSYQQNSYYAVPVLLSALGEHP